MPIQVDHGAQRELVVTLATRVVADEGVPSLTFRRVAEQAGTSTAIVSTYFTDKRDLLASTLRAAATRTSVRFESALAGGAGLRGALEAWLPLDDERLDDWKVVVAFWGVAVADPEFAAIQEGHAKRARERIARLLRGADPSGRAQQIFALTLGIALQAVFAPVPPRRQRRLLAEGLTRLQH